MSLFPAYSADKIDTQIEATTASLDWLVNESCPPEVGQQPLLNPSHSVSSEDVKTSNEPKEGAESPQHAQSRSPSLKRKRKKKKKKKKKKSYKISSSSSDSCDEEMKRSRSRIRGSRYKSGTSRSKSRSRTRSSSTSVSGRSRSRTKRSKSKSRTRRSRSRSRTRRSRSRSRTIRSRSRSRTQRSRSRSRTRRSRSRSRTRRSRSRTQRSRSRSRARRLRSRTRRSRSRSKTRTRRSRSRTRSISKSRLRSRTRNTGSGTRREMGNRSPQSHDRKSSELVMSKNKSVFLEDLHGLVKPEEAFFISTHGNKNNSVQQTTHYSELSRYKIKTRGTLGSCFSREQSAQSTKKPSRYFKRSEWRIFSDANVVRAYPKEILDKRGKEDQEKYIPIELTYAEEVQVKKAPQQSEVNPLGIQDSVTEMYLLGIGGLKQEKSPQSSREVENEYWQNQSKVYNERLSKEPFNVSLWLEFIRFQDEAYMYTFNEKDLKNRDMKIKHKKNQKALAERKISILDCAIKKNYRSLELQFQRLQIGEDIWDDKKLKHEWATLIFNYPNKMIVWSQYLAFMQTHFTSFNLPAVVQAFAKCTEKLQQMQSGVFVTHSPPPDLGRCLVDIAVQLAHVWRQGGHMERSIALFQALIELNLFAPKHASTKDTPLDARLVLFEPFWDSRAPRFGEEKAIGWTQVMEMRQDVNYPEVILGGTQDEEDVIIAQGGTSSNLWVALETSREKRHWLPWEQDPEDCEDPERMVPFEELSPHLFVLDSVEECFYLILQFLKFLGVPDMEKYVLKKTTSGRAENNDDIERKSNGTDAMFKPLITETLNDTNLFGSRLNLRKESNTNPLNFEAVGPSLMKASCEDYHLFLCRIVQQALDVFDLSYRKKLTVLYIRLLCMRYLVRKKCASDKEKLKSFGKELKKQIKNIIKSEEFRVYLPVYQEYGKLEEIMEHFDDAENVYTMALSIGTAAGNALDVTNRDFPFILDLYISYIQYEISRETKVCSGKHSNNVIYSLCSLIMDGKFSIANGSLISGGNILKTKKKLLEMQKLYNNSLTLKVGSESKKDNEEMFAIKIVSFLALLQLLTVGFKPACLMFETSIEQTKDLFEDHTPHKLEDISLPAAENPKTQCSQGKSKCNQSEKLRILEILYEDYLWLIEVSAKLDHLVRNGSMSRQSLRSVLTSAIRIAPENQRFLLLLAQIQSSRDLLGGFEILPKKSDSIVVLVSQLLPHIERTITVMSKKNEELLNCGHRLEYVLEKAVSRPPGSHCPLLWRLYMSLVAATRPKGLKEVIYRALTHCCGVKSVYLDCVHLMPEMLKEVMALLSEKNTRVRLPLEELQVLTETELDLEGETEENIVDLEEEENQ